MHVLIIPSWYPTKNNSLSGIFFKEQAEALAKRSEIEVGCISINESSLRYIFSKKEKSFDYYTKDINAVNTIGVLYPIVNRLKVLRKFVKLIVFKILFKKYIKLYGIPDLIHLHSFSHGNLAIWVKDTYNIKYIVTEHSSGFSRGIYDQRELEYAKSVFFKSIHNISVSNEFSKLLKSIFNIDFDYLPNSINTDYFDMKKNDKCTDSFNFINIAFLDKNKNHSLLIKSFSNAFKNKDNISLTIVGDGPEFKNLMNLIDDLKMQKQIILFGRANRNQVKELLHKSNAFVLSSKYETFGVVLIEAMSCGLPVLSTKCGGPESIIEEDKLGLLVDNNSIKELSQGMKNIYKTNYDEKYIRDYILNHFSSEIVSQKLIKIYESKL